MLGRCYSHLTYRETEAWVADPRTAAQGGKRRPAPKSDGWASCPALSLAGMASVAPAGVLGVQCS